MTATLLQKTSNNITTLSSLTRLENESLYFTGIDKLFLPATVTTVEGHFYGGSFGAASKRFETASNHPVFSAIDGVLFGSFAFVSTSVKSFSIPVNAYYIGDGALCTNNLESITVKPTNTQFVTDINGILYDKTHHDYSNCYTLLACPKTVRGNLHIDDKVSVIAAYAFKGCSNLNSVTVSANLITIGAFAFTYSGLHEIKFAGPPPAFSDKSFAEVTANAYYPTDKGWTSANMKNYGGNLTWIPDSIEQLEQLEQFVLRCYRLMMDREGDTSGVNYWTNELTSGRQGGASIVDQFVSSKEFASKNLSNTETVSLIYHTMLNREPDSGGLAYWQGFLDDGASPHYIVFGFSGAQEFKDLCCSYGINPGKINLTEYRDKNIKVTQFVNRNYRYALERKGEANGLNYWCEQIIKKTQTPKQCANNFVFSKECINRNLSDENFVRMLYNLYMGRTADQGGLNYWTGQLRNGMTRQQVANSFADSPEFRNIVAGYGL